MNKSKIGKNLNKIHISVFGSFMIIGLVLIILCVIYTLFLFFKSDEYFQLKYHSLKDREACMKEFRERGLAGRHTIAPCPGIAQ